MLDTLHIDEYEEMLAREQEEDDLDGLINYYHKQLLNNPVALKSLITTGLSERLMFRHQIGYCDRSLNSLIQNSISIDGDAFRGCLRRLELIKPTGHELFSGCIIEPYYDLNKRLISICGVKLNRISRPAPEIIHWFRDKVFDMPLKFKLTQMGQSHVN
ncbi:MAG: hypothetical protein HKP09_06235 [Enterobacterales bacterium]|nr:hypothetical protein [Enterobacterales bacterium]